MPPCSDEALAAFEELFLYACPKFIHANSPPYDDPVALSQLITPQSPSSEPPVDELPNGYSDPAQRHLRLFLSDVSAQAPVPTLRSFLKLYTSLGSKKLANFLDADEEEMVQEMMVMKQFSRSISRVGGEKGGLLEGQTISTSDMNFVIDQVRQVRLCGQTILTDILQNMVHIAESTVGRRYAGWFIKNTERTQRIFEDLKNTPLPTPSKAAAAAASVGSDAAPAKRQQKVAWGGVNVKG